MSKKKINIGITIDVADYAITTVFSNGIRQNIISLQELFQKCKNVKNSYIINTSSNKTNYVGTTWEKYGSFIISKEEAKEKCDLIVVCHGSISVSEYEEYAKLGKKLVNQILGAELTAFNERVVFNLPDMGIYKKNNNVSAVWMSPHFYERDQYFFQAMFGCGTFFAPYIWTPKFLEEHVNLFKNQSPPWVKYIPSGNLQKRIATMEPNINIVKTSIVPIITAELLERKHPEVLKSFSVFGGEKIKLKKDIIDFVKDLNINKNKKCFFEARYPVVWTLKEHTDIVLSHQNQCELNYLYLDAAWLGYPIVHNSPMMKELGWYYPDNNSEIAVKHIEYIAKNFDTNEYVDDKYLNKSREYASQFLPDNPKNIKAYEKLIDIVVQQKGKYEKN